MSGINNDETGEQKEVQQDKPSEVLCGVSSSDIHDNSSNNSSNDDDDNNSNPSYNRSDDECEAEEEAEAEQQRYTQHNFYHALPQDIKQELDLCTGWDIVRQNPIKFVIAHRGKNQILRAEIQKQKRYRTTDAVNQEKEEYDVSVFAQTDVLINAIPTVITEHIDPVLSEISSLASGVAGQQHRYTIKFRTTKGDRFTLSYMTLSEIFAELDTMALVAAPAGAEKALNTIVNSFRNFDKIKVKTEIKAPGFYLIKGKIKAYNILKHPMPSQQQIQECIEFVDDKLYPKFFSTRSELLPTFIKWGVMAPFSFIIKQLKAPFMPALFSYGSANAAKTTLGKIALSIYSYYVTNNQDGIPFDLANTPARLGEIISSSTYGILVNEVSALAEPQYRHMVELFKSVIENTQARGGFFNNSNRRVMSLILALGNLILTGNAQPPADTGFARRYLSIPFSSSDQLDPANPEHAKRMEEFTIVFNENRHKLKYLGDFAVNYIMNINPDILLAINKSVNEGGSSGNWQNIAKTIITEFYKTAGKESSPAWIDKFISLDQIAESKEDAIILFRSFLIDFINSQYTRNLKSFELSETIPNPDNEDNTLTVMRERNLSERLEFLLDHELISFIKKNDNGEVCIFSSILQELRQFRGSIYGGSTSNIPSMQDIGNFLRLPYDQQRIGNTRPRIVHGSLIKLKEFLDMSIAQTLELNEVDERQIQTPG